MKDLDGIEVVHRQPPGWWAIVRRMVLSDPLASRGAGFGYFADRRGMSAMDCAVYLHRRVASARAAAERAASVFGRVFNALTGERGDRVLASGHVLGVAGRVTGQVAFAGLDEGLEYKVDLASAERLLAALRREVGR